MRYIKKGGEGGGTYPDKSMYTDDSVPCSLDYIVIKAITITCTVQTDVSTGKLVADVLEVLF